MAAEGRSSYFGNIQRDSRPQERIYRNAHLRNKRGGSQGGSEKSQSLSPVSVISVSSNSKYPSVSPPKLVDAPTKKDTYERSPSNHRSSIPRSNASDNVRTRNIHLSRNCAQSRGISSPKRSRSRSRSLPKRYRQRSRSPYKPARRRRSQSRSDRHRRSRSQSRGRTDRHRRSRSRGRHFRSHRSRSPGRPMKSRRSRSRSASPRSSGRHWSKSRSRSREPARRRHRSRTVSPRNRSGSHKRVDERGLWEAFRVQMRDLEEKWEEERKLYEKNPESHPDYKMEWKTFYKRRVQELIERGDDPKLHNFESDWAYFWKFRMDELLKLEYERRKVAVKRRLCLPDDAEMPAHFQAREIAEMTNRLSSTGGGCPGLISTLRIVTAVEEQLGSLGPRVNVLLSKAVTLQRISGSNPDSLLADQENVILLETVKEKLLGQLQTKIVKKSLEAPVEEAVISIATLVNSVASSYPITAMGSLVSLGGDINTMPQNSVTSNVVNVGGVGQVDRVAIAQQIADALIMQGKTDVTEAELQELVNSVVGMVEAQSVVERMNQPKVMSDKPEIVEPMKVTVVEDTPNDNMSVQDSQVVSSSVLSNPAKVSESVMLLSTVEESRSAKPQLQENEAFNILMSVVKSGIRQSDSFEKSQSWSSDDSDEPSNSEIVQNKSNPAKNSLHDFEKESLVGESSLSVDPDLNKAAEVTNSNEVPEEGTCSSAFGKKNSQKWYKRVNRSPSPEIFKALKQKSMMAGMQEVAKSRSNARMWNKDLSPFSSREETSNPLAASEEEDEDLKVIGAWDSDSDIDLDSCGKTKVPAYDKINVRKQSPAKYEKNTSQMNKAKITNLSISSPISVSSDLNLDATIDNLMGKLNNKTSKIEVISGKQSDLLLNAHSVNPIQSILSLQSDSQGQYFPNQSQPSVTNQGYGMPYNYPHQQMYSGQPGYYNSGSVPNYNQYSGQPYGNYPSGRTASQSYLNPSGGTVVYSTNSAQWQNYYGQQQMSFPPKQGGNTSYGNFKPSYQ